MKDYIKEKTIKAETITSSLGTYVVALVARTYLYHVPHDTRYRVTAYSSSLSDSSFFDTYEDALEEYNGIIETLVEL